MDRTSILGDTIDYMKELLEKITDLQQEIGFDNSNMVGVLKDAKPNEVIMRNSPKVWNRSFTVYVYIEANNQSLSYF